MLVLIQLFIQKILTMKAINLKLISILLIAVLSLTVSCNKFPGRRIDPIGHGTVSFKNCQNFNSIRVSRGLDVELFIGDYECVKVEAPESFIPYIEVFVHEGELVVRVRSGRHLNINGPSDKPRISVFAKSIRDIELSGASSINANGLIQTGRLSVELSGSSYFKGVVENSLVDMELSGASRADLNVDAAKLNLELNGSSKVNLLGQANYLNFELSGSSRVESYDFIVNYLDAEMSGGSVAKVHVEEELSVDASGGATLYYKGNGVVIFKDLSGGADIEKVD